MNEWEAVFEHAETDGVPILSVRGEIDLSAASRFTQALDQLIDNQAPVKAVDLTEVAFIDSAGVRELLKARLSAEAAGSELILKSPSVACRRVLELSGVLLEFTITGVE